MKVIVVRLRWHIAYVLFLALALQGCAEVNSLRDAQDTFSQTAALENDLRFGPAKPESFNPGIHASVSTSVSAGYASVIHTLNSLDEKAVGKLNAENLYGVVLTLKAMSYWRLGDSDAATTVAKQALELDPPQLGPRDRALMTAMPGLIRNEQAFQKLYAPVDATTPWDQRIKSIVGLLNSTEQKLAEARKHAPADHDVQLYLVQAQLAADKNLNDACVMYANAGGALDTAKLRKCKGAGSGSDWGSKPRYSCRTHAHMKAFEGLLVPGQQQAAQPWRKAVGSPPEQKPDDCP